MKRGSAFPITRLSAIGGKTTALTAVMVWWLIGALISMARNRSSLCLARTDRVNCRKPLPSLIGFCVYILEAAAAQNRQRLLLKRPGELANWLPPLTRSSSILILPMHPLPGALHCSAARCVLYRARLPG